MRSFQKTPLVPKRKKVMRCAHCKIKVTGWGWIIYWGERLCYPCCVAADKAKKNAKTDKEQATADAKAKAKERASKKLSQK